MGLRARRRAPGAGHGRSGGDVKYMVVRDADNDHLLADLPQLVVTWRSACEIARTTHNRPRDLAAEVCRALRENDVLYPEIRIFRYGAEIVPAVELLLKGAIVVESLRRTYRRQGMFFWQDVGESFGRWGWTSRTPRWPSSSSTTTWWSSGWQMFNKKAIPHLPVAVRDGHDQEDCPRRPMAVAFERCKSYN